MSTIELVVTDLDGTLWDTAEQLHPRTASAIADLSRRGVHLLVATGRRVTSTREPLARIGLAPAAVVLNGALALDLATSGRFHRHPFPTGQAASVLDGFVAAGLEPCLYVDHHDVDVFIGASPSTHPDHIAGLGRTVREGDLRTVIEEHAVLAFGIMGRPIEQLRPAAEAIGDRAETHLGRALAFPGAALTVAPRGLSKWAGVLAYCEIWELDRSSVLAVGDGPNDLELLAQAAIAVVPQGSHEDALARADYIIGPPERGGWADIVEFLS
jgi:hydroxymethylpyrimidine pyrophosphatase-like HAD family hydrolase